MREKLFLYNRYKRCKLLAYDNLQMKTLMHKGTFLFMIDVYVQLIACTKKYLI